MHLHNLSIDLCPFSQDTTTLIGTSAQEQVFLITSKAVNLQPMQMCNSLNTTRNLWVIHRCWGCFKTHRKIQRGWGFVNERCSKWFLDCTTTTTARQLLSNIGGLVLQIPLYSTGSGLKAHLTCWAAGNQTVECTCLLSWPTSSLLFNYSRALKCSSVWPTADSPTSTGWPSCQQHYRGSI